MITYYSDVFCHFESQWNCVAVGSERKQIAKFGTGGRPGSRGRGPKTKAKTRLGWAHLPTPANAQTKPRGCLKFVETKGLRI